MPQPNFIPNEYILQKRSDITWRKWLDMLWNDVEWPFITLLAIFSFGLGLYGFGVYFDSFGKQSSLLDCIFFSLQLFTLDGSQIEPGSSIPLALQVARFLSPGLAAYTLVQAFMVVFREQLELFKIVRIRKHAVICGLGQKGLLLVKDLRKKDISVVVVERDSNNPHLDVCRELGAPAIIGDARETVILLKAGTKHARKLFVVCGDDGTNVEVAEAAEKLVQKQDHRQQRKEILHCMIHISDTYLWTVLKEREFSKDQGSSFRFEMFNIYHAGARMLLRDAYQYNTPEKPHLLVIGMGELAEHLLIHAARGWRLYNKFADDRIVITVVDPEAKQKLEAMQIRYPLIKDTCECHAYQYKTNWPEFYKGVFLGETEIKTPVTNAYICFDDSTLGLQAGFVLLQLIQKKGLNTQIMVRMTEDTGLASFVSEMKSPELKNMRAFGLLDRTCRAELLDDGTHEALARVIHEDYCRREALKGTTQEINPYLVPWEQLPEEIKESNRKQADHISIKLQEIGCRMVPWRDYDGHEFVFTIKEIEILSRLEHKRWCEERERNGWEFGEPRDDSRKIHPDLVLWESLSEETKDKDREAVRLVPSLLAQAGFQIVEKENVFGDFRRRTAGD